MRFCLFLCFSLLFLFTETAQAFTQTPASFFTLDKAPQLGKMANFKASALCNVADKTQYYLAHFSEDKFAVHAGKVFDESVTLSRVEQTLAFICHTYREDVRANRNSRLHDPDFLTSHFDFYRWTPDIASARSIALKSTNARKSSMLNAIPTDKIFLTKYYTKLLTASNVKTLVYNQALYALPYDEIGLTLGEVNGKRRYFNVHRNNGIAYDYAIGKREQARYWYFSEVSSIMGYGETLENKIAIQPQVSFAGNVADLGLGKLFMVSYKQAGNEISRLGVLSDQGGAFDNNLFQLDLLVDSYFGWKDYHQANKQLPDYASAWLMLIKP